MLVLNICKYTAHSFYVKTPELTCFGESVIIADNPAAEVVNTFLCISQPFLSARPFIQNHKAFEQSSRTFTVNTLQDLTGSAGGIAFTQMLPIIEFRAFLRNFQVYLIPEKRMGFCQTCRDDSPADRTAHTDLSCMNIQKLTELSIFAPYFHKAVSRLSGSIRI